MNKIRTDGTLSDNVPIIAENSTICLSVSYAFRDKEAQNKSAFAFNWQTKAMSQAAIIDHVRRGYALSPATYTNGHRSKPNFEQAQLIGLDFDTIGIAEALNNPFIAKYAFAVLATASSTPQAPRCRVYFQLDKPITDSSKFEAVLTTLHAYFAPLKPDSSCIDAARFYYGAANKPSHENLGAIVPLEVLEALALLTPLNAPKQAQNKAQATNTPKATRSPKQAPSFSSSIDSQWFTTNCERAAQALGLSYSSADNWIPCHCPLHEDKHKSAAFNGAIGLFKCHSSNCAVDTLTLVELAQLGVFELYTSTPEATQARGLPNGIREAMLQAKLGNTARLFDSLLASGYELGRVYAQAELIGITGYSPSMVSRALKWVKSIFAGIARNHLAMFTTQKHFCKNGILHNASKFLYLPSISELSRYFEQTVLTASTVLAPEAFTNTSLYRQALNRAYIEARSGQQIYRSELAKRLGLTTSTISRYNNADSSISIEPVLNRVLITSADKLPEADKLGRYWLEYELNGVVQRARATRQKVEYHLAKNRQVYLCNREANIYYYVNGTEAPLIGSMNISQNTALEGDTTSLSYEGVIFSTNAALEVEGTSQQATIASQADKLARLKSKLPTKANRAQELIEITVNGNFEQVLERLFPQGDYPEQAPQREAALVGNGAHKQKSMFSRSINHYEHGG